jgi:uncharacterized membrane protein
MDHCLFGIFFAIALFVFQLTASDYTFGMLKLFCQDMYEVFRIAHILSYR